MQRQRRLLSPARLPARFVVPAVLAGLGVASAASAQPQPYTEEPTEYRSSKPYQAEVERAERERARAAGEDDGSPFSFSGGVDFRSQYIFRGYNFVSSGFMAQPYATLGYTVFEDQNLTVTPHVGAWLNLAEETGPEEPVHFHEFDGIGGVGVAWKDFTFDFQYIVYTFPNNTFKDSHEVGVNVHYDDSRFWGGRGPVTGLNPSFALFYEVRDDNTPAGANEDHNTYVGLGLEPALRECNVGPVPVTVTFPLVLGGSYDGYYTDDGGSNATFGYWSAGVKASVPLPRTAYGMDWRLEAEVNYIRLTADSAEAANGYDNDDIVFRLGLSFR